MPKELSHLLHPLELLRARKYCSFIYTTEVDGKKLAYTELLKLFIRFMEKSIHDKFSQEGVLDGRDFRSALFVRIEIAIATYYHSVKQSLANFDEIISDSLELGYDLEFALLLAGGEREVQLRTSFLDRYFYTIDHFIQCMEREFSFASADNTKRKQQVFQEMLKHFGLEENAFTPKRIFDLISTGRSANNSDFLEALRDNSDRKIKYSDLYEYVANVRNSLHNNGYSNKTLNNLSVGKLKYEMRKGEFLRCLSLPHLVALLIPLTKILEEVVTKAVAIKPDFILDPFGEEVRRHLEKNMPRG
jgi:hypothetical protein